jgi:hypothetical protein
MGQTPAGGRGMVKQFEREGVRFQYPDNWTVETEDTDDGWNVSLQSPETAFFLLSAYPDEDDPSHVADRTLAAMREDYPQLEAEAVMDTIGGQPAIGHDMEFFAFDLTNSCWTRCLQGPDGCLLVLCQCTDQELDSQGAVLRAVSASLQIDEAGA